MTLLALLCLLTPAEAGRKPVIPDAVDDALVYAETDREKAIQVLEEALQGARAKHAGQLELYVGEQYRLSGDEEASREHFQAAISSGDKHAREAAEVGLVLLDADKGVHARGLSLLEKADGRLIPESLDAERHLLLAVHAARSDDARGVERHTAEAIRLGGADPVTLGRVKAGVAALQAGRLDDVTVGEDEGPLDRARKALERGDKGRASELARKALEGLDPESEEALAARYLEKRATMGNPVDGNRITVLLPLSGKYTGAGKMVQGAFEMGYRQAGGRHELVFVDSGVDEASTVAALEKAVLDQGSVAVVGPLLSETTDAVVQAANALEVPLLSLSQSNEENRPWVLQGVPTVGDQTEALVEHVMTAEGMKTFGIFAPDSPYGHRAAEVFRSEVEARGGSVTGEVFYDPDANALMTFAAKLGNKDDPSRKGELWRLRKAAEAAGRDGSTVVLPPRVDFDAIFLPESARKVPIACAALAYEEFPVGEFRPRAGEELMPLLGLDGWNRGSLVSAGGEYVRNSRFTEVYLPEDNAGFVTAYREKTTRTPSAMEAKVVDAGRLLGAASQAGANDRDTFREALAGASITGSATGLQELEDGRPDTPVRILTITRQGIQTLEEAQSEGDPSDGG